jgi:hypothetical protein
MVPNPTKLRSLVKHEDVERRRSLCCVEYDDCLDTVLRNAWKSWTCEQCTLFSRTRDCRAAHIAHEAAQRPFA